MENIKNKYYLVHKKYLAFALSYLGFHYYKFDGEIYSFLNTPEFQTALTELTELKNKFK